MKMNDARRGRGGLTWVEVLVAVVILVGLGFFAVGWVKGQLMRGAYSVTLSDMKQLHLATQQMALDGVEEKETNLRWPGDNGGTFTNWLATLVPGYLSTNDFCRLITVGGRSINTHGLPGANTNTILVYAVTINSVPNTIFLSTANFTNTAAGGVFNAAGLPNGKYGFVYFRQAGDGGIGKPKQVGNTNAVGGFVPLLR